MTAGPKSIVINVTAGLAIGINIIIVCLSFAALFVFSGLPADYLTQIAGLYLLGAAVVMGIYSVYSSLPIAIAAPQSHATAILLIMVEQITELTQGHPTELFPTVFMAIAISTMLTGLCYFSLGYLRKGNLIRYIPYPVIGGFLAGVGWVTLVWAILAMTGDDPAHVSAAGLIMAVAALVMAIAALVIERLYKQPLAILYMLIAGTLIFYLVLFLTHYTLTEVMRSGWLLETSATEQLWYLPTFSTLTSVNWRVINSMLPLIFVMLVVSNVSFLLNAMSDEITTHSDIDFNRELYVAGIANLAAGIGGGVVGYLTATQTTLVKKLGADSRSVGLIAAGCCLLTLIFGVGYLQYLPKFVLFSMLIFVAISFLIRWLYKTYFRLSRRDYLMLVSIFLIITLFGFLQGVLAGIVISIILFVIDYSRINVVKYSLTGKSIHSNKLRTPKLQNILHERGDLLVYFKLQGYIFFGTAYTLLEQIRDYINQSTQPCKFMIFDCTLVTGIDSSAIQYFLRLKQLAKEYQFSLVFTDVSVEVLDEFRQENIINNVDLSVIYVFESLDYGLEWCEESIISDLSHLFDKPESFAKQLEDLVASPEKAQGMVKYFEKKIIPKGEYLINQGNPSEGLYFVESGQISVLLHLPSLTMVRLRKMGAGNVIGEMGFYANRLRTASVIADENCILRFLSRAALRKMEQDEPELAIVFHKTIISIITDRLVYRNHQVEALIGAVSENGD